MGTQDSPGWAPAPRPSGQRHIKLTGEQARNAIVGAAGLACLALVLGSAYLDLTIANAPYPDVGWGFLESLLAVWVPIAVFGLGSWLALREVGRRRGGGPTDFAKGCALFTGCLPVVVLLVPAVVASASLVASWGYRDQIRAVATQFARVCSEKVGVDAAAAHEPGAENAVIVLDADGRPGNWTAEAFQRGWSTMAASEVQIVACIGPDEQNKEVICHYSEGGTWSAMTHRRSVTLLSARTGAPMGSYTSTTGGGCPDQKTVGGPGFSQDDPVEWDSYALWRFIEAGTGN